MDTNNTPFNGTVDPVIAYLQSYTGTNDFLQSVKRAQERWGLTDRQYAAVAKFMANANRPQAAQSSVRFDSLPEGTTYHAVTSADGQLSFYRVDRVADKASRWNGWTFVKQVIGGGLSGGAGVQEKRGSARPGEAYRGTHEAQMSAIVADPKTSMATFGQHIGRCGRCGKLLTDETSRTVGIGPICREALGF